MIYKFESDGIELEVELVQDFDMETKKLMLECVNLSAKKWNEEHWITIGLDKKDIYHLIGALHQLHKEMK